MAQIALDHHNARTLAEGLARIPGLGLDPASVETNIVLFDVSGLGVDAEAFEAHLEARGVFASVFTSTLIRFITYRDIGSDAVEEVLEIVGDVADEVRGA